MENNKEHNLPFTEREPTEEELEFLRQQTNLLKAQIRITSAEADEIEARSGSQSARHKEERVRADRAELEYDLAFLRADRERRQIAVAGIQEGALGTFEFNQVLTNNYAQNGPFGLHETKGTVEPFIAKLTDFAKQNPGETITIILNSPGGMVSAGVRLYGELRSLSAKGSRIITVGSGRVASAAGVVLQAGDVRLMDPMSTLLIHKVSSGVQGSEYEIDDQLKEIKRLDREIRDLFVERSGGKITKKDFDKNWARKDWMLDPRESVKLGFIDDLRENWDADNSDGTPVPIVRKPDNPITLKGRD